TSTRWCSRRALCACPASCGRGASRRYRILRRRADRFCVDVPALPGFHTLAAELDPLRGFAALPSSLVVDPSARRLSGAPRRAIGREGAGNHDLIVVCEQLQRSPDWRFRTALPPQNGSAI